MRMAVIAAVMLVASSSDALAQDESTITSHQRAAAELIELLDLETAAGATGDAMMQAVAQHDPMSAELMELVVAFTREFTRWEDLRPEYIRIYCNAFTEDELKLLVVVQPIPDFSTTSDSYTFPSTGEWPGPMNEGRVDGSQEEAPVHA